MSFETRPTATGVGAEIVGLDLSGPIDEATRRALNAAWLDAGILVFRGIGTDADAHRELSRCFGELEVHPVESIRLAGCPEIIELKNGYSEEMSVHYFDDQPVEGRIPWHTDMIYTTRPCRGALLRMVEAPAAGGETGWIDTAAAYDALPEVSKERVEGVEARFDFVEDICDMRFGRPDNMRHAARSSKDFGHFDPVAHPLVWTHPLSGRRAIMVSPVQLIEVVGMPKEEGDALLEELVAFVTSGRFTYVHEWAEGDMVLWDNWRTMHQAFGTPAGLKRTVHRTSLRGEYDMGRVL